MKRRRTIVTGRSPISDAEITGLRPQFSVLKKSMASETTPGKRAVFLQGKGLLIALSGVAAASLAFLLWQLILLQQPVNEAEPLEALMVAEAVGTPVSPPEPDIKEYEVFTVHPTQESKFTTRKGSTITVPPLAFTFPDGTICLEPVELKFSEYHNVAEIFLSGIPMMYDSAGVSYTFESAGMFDIRAYHQGQNLVLADQKEIGIDLVSNAEGIYNFYYFDSTVNQWTYLFTESPDDITPITTPTPLPSPPALASDFTIPDLDQFIIPSNGSAVVILLRREDPRNFAFRVAFDEEEFPELVDIQDLIFELGTGSLAAHYLSGRWDSMMLSRVTEQEYEITLHRRHGELSFPARPVLDLPGSEDEKDQRRKELAQRRQEIADLHAAIDADPRSIRMAGVASSQWAMRRGTKISSLGIYNWDLPVPEPQHAMAGAGIFVDESGKPLAPSTIFLAQKGVTILWSYNPTQPWKYSESLDNILWFTLPDGKYAMVNDAAIREGNKAGKIAARIVTRETALQEIASYI